MNIQIDRTKVYTSGEWVHGTISLYLSVFAVKEITVQLKETLTYHGRGSDCGKGPAVFRETEFYSISENIDCEAWKAHTSNQADSKTFDFAIRFPGHEYDNYQNLPATIIDEGFWKTSIDIHHLITVNVIVLKSQPETLQQTLGLEFMPSASISRLLEPSVSYHKSSFGGLPLAANISLPRYLVQRGAANTIKIELPSTEKSEYQLLLVKVKLKFYVHAWGQDFANHYASMWENYKELKRYCRGYPTGCVRYVSFLFIVRCENAI